MAPANSNTIKSSTTSYRVPIYTPGSRAAMWINCLAEGQKCRGDGGIRTSAWESSEYTNIPQHLWYCERDAVDAVAYPGGWGGGGNRRPLNLMIDHFGIPFCIRMLKTLELAGPAYWPWTLSVNYLWKICQSLSPHVYLLFSTSLCYFAVHVHVFHVLDFESQRNW